MEERDRSFQPGPYSKVKFEDSAHEIHLIIPEGANSGWKMRQLNQLVVYTYCKIKNNFTDSKIIRVLHVLQVSREDVDKYKSVAGHKLIPCQVKVEWIGGEKKASFSHFCYEVEFHGARENSYFLAVTLPQLCLCE